MTIKKYFLIEKGGLGSGRHPENKIDDIKINWKKETGASDIDKQLSDKILRGNETYKEYFRNEKGLESRIVLMSPEEYITLSAEIHDVSIEKEINSATRDIVLTLAHLMKEGREFYLPWISYATNSQEGRHRALAAIQLGIKEIPVVIERKIK